MKVSWFSLYDLVLALWVGGIACFTFVVTPVIFRSYERDMAGEIVGKLFPGYFLYNVILTAAALVLCFLLAADHSARPYRLSLILLSTALIISLFITFKLYPEVVRVKQEVASFERTTPDSPARNKFRRLHGVSALLNLTLLAEGVTLLIVSPLLKK